MTLQTGGALPSSSLELLLHSSVETKVVMAVIGVFSLGAWFIIGLKWVQFRRVRAQANRFFGVLERATTLREGYNAMMSLPTSPYTRLFREGMHFVGELRPGALKTDAGTHALTPTQLEALKMVLGKEIAAERDHLNRYIAALATIGSVGPLLGLLGTVLGVMDAFIGIAAKGSGNISAVAPGVAEALVTTVAGLFAAIPAVIGYNLFVARVRGITSELDGFGNELIGSMAREGLI